VAKKKKNTAAPAKVSASDSRAKDKKAPSVATEKEPQQITPRIGINPRYLELGAFIAILLLGTVLRFWDLGVKGLWFDEYQTLLDSQKPYLDILRGNVHQPYAPLQYLIEHTSLLFGDSEFYARLPWTIFGSGCIIAVYHIGRSWFGPAIALASTLIFALNPTQILHAQDAKPYTLFCLLVLYGSFFLVRAAEKSHLKNWVPYLVIAVLLRFIHPYSNYVFLTHFLFFFIVSLPKLRQPETRKQLLLTGGVIFAVVILMTYGYWDLVANRLKKIVGSYKTKEYNLLRDLSFFQITLNYFYLGVWSVNVKFYPYIHSIVYAVLLGSALIYMSIDSKIRRNGLFVAGNALVPLLLGFVFVFVVITVPRYFLFTMPFLIYLAVIGAAGIIRLIVHITAKLKKPMLVTGACTVLMFGGYFYDSMPWLVNYYNEGYHANSHKGAVKKAYEKIREIYQPGDLLYGFSRDHMTFAVLDWYLKDLISEEDKRYFKGVSQSTIDNIPQDRRIIVFSVHDKVGGDAIIKIKKKFKLFRIHVVLTSHILVIDPNERTPSDRLKNPNLQEDEKVANGQRPLIFRGHEFDIFGNFIVPAEVIYSKTTVPVLNKIKFIYLILFDEPGEYKVTVRAYKAVDFPVTWKMSVARGEKFKPEPITGEGWIEFTGTVDSKRGYSPLVLEFKSTKKLKDKRTRLMYIDKITLTKQ
jgi:Dolichyl-phosphate-mannose-protein mannosyltransferase